MSTNLEQNLQILGLLAQIATNNPDQRFMQIINTLRTLHIAYYDDNEYVLNALRGEIAHDSKKGV